MSMRACQISELSMKTHTFSQAYFKRENKIEKNEEAKHLAQINFPGCIFQCKIAEQYKYIRNSQDNQIQECPISTRMVAMFVAQ